MHASIQTEGMHHKAGAFPRLNNVVCPRTMIRWRLLMHCSGLVTSWRATLASIRTDHAQSSRAPIGNRRGRRPFRHGRPGIESFLHNVIRSRKMICWRLSMHRELSGFVTSWRADLAFNSDGACSLAMFARARASPPPFSWVNRRGRRPICLAPYVRP